MMVSKKKHTQQLHQADSSDKSVVNDVDKSDSYPDIMS